MKQEQEQDNDLILIIDSNALIHRAYHAYPDTLTTLDGTQTNAVFGFTTMLLQSLQKFQPKYVVCAFDAGKITLRHEQYADYKANRKEMDVELREQLPIVKRVVDALNIPRFELDGYEADDIIGTLVCGGLLPESLQKVVVTGDKDLLQLVNDENHAQIFLSGFNFNSSKVYDEAAVFEKFGFEPRYVPDYKGLMGDPSDNIPGVKGVGKKGGADLIKQFGALENVYDSLEANEEIWQQQPFKRMAKKLQQQKAEAQLSKDLATIKCDVNVPFELVATELEDYDHSEVAELFQELQFKSLLKKLPQSNQREASKDDPYKPLATGSQTNMFSATAEQAHYGFANAQIQIFEQMSGAAAAIDTIKGAAEIAFDTETFGDNNPVSIKPVGIGIAISSQEAFYFTGEILNDEAFKQELQTILDDTSKKIIAHNLKFDMHSLTNLGLSFEESDHHFDTLIAAHMLFAGDKTAGKGLKKLAKSELGIEMKSFKELFANVDHDDIRKLDYAVVGEYCCTDCLATYQLYKSFSESMETNSQQQALFTQIEMPLIQVLFKMEREGIAVDASVLEDIGKEAKNQAQHLENKIYLEAGQEFNINSPKQVSQILFEELRIQEGSEMQPKRTKSGAYSTSERVLRDFAAVSAIVEEILRYRELTKLKSTYIDALIELANNQDGRIHTTYNQAIASTGRLSSTNPNLQNIPVTSDLGRKVRKAFEGGDGRLLYAFDYAQQELRLLAHLSGEQHLIDAFKQGDDIHALTAAKLYGKQSQDVTKKERRVGKTVNFGIIYGISAFGLADRLKIDRGIAQQFIDAFFASYPQVKKYFADLKNKAYTEGEIYTLLGRRRDTSGLKASNFRLKNALEREVLNYPLQGGAADIMKQAMLEVNALLLQAEWREQGIKMHLQIHDELVLSMPTDIPQEKQQDMAKQIQKAMQEVVSLSVPMLVDIERGENWYELKSIS